MKSENFIPDCENNEVDFLLLNKPITLFLRMIILYFLIGCINLNLIKHATVDMPRIITN